MKSVIIFSVGQYTDEDTWETFQADLASNLTGDQYSASLAQFFTKNVFYGQAEFGASDFEYYLFCVGEALYGGYCAGVSGGSSYTVTLYS